MQIQDLDIEAIQRRNREALSFVVGQVLGSEYAPETVMEHFDQDVPALIDALGRSFAVIKQNAITEAARRQRTDDDDLGPSPAELGDTMTVEAGEWTPLDDIGTQIYVYGDRPVDIAVQVAEVDNEIRRLRAQVEQLSKQLDSRARSEARLTGAFESLIQDIDGGEVDTDAEIPAGEIRRVFHEATTGKKESQ